MFALKKGNLENIVVKDVSHSKNMILDILKGNPSAGPGYHTFKCWCCYLP